MKKAEAWLDDVHFSPVKLRKLRILAIKKTAEHLGAYYKLWKFYDGKDKERILGKMNALATKYITPEFHDLTKASDDLFQQESLSYLRIAWILSQIHYPVDAYKKEIFGIKSRLEEHLKNRGPYQRELFAFYGAELGMKEFKALEGSLRNGLIYKERQNPKEFSNDEAYVFTHEIFSLTHYSESLPIKKLGRQELEYIQTSLKNLLVRYKLEAALDLFSELVTCQASLNGLSKVDLSDNQRFILDHQNADGSWGVYEKMKRESGPLVEVLFRLHTTMVAIEAVTVSAMRLKR